MFDQHVFTIIGLGFVLGLRHALDADHIAAVSTVLAERPGLRASSAIGFFWGVGHTLMLLIVGMCVLALNVAIPEFLAVTFEFAVGVMLVWLGLSLAWRLYRERWHVHTHEHEGEQHIHLHHHRTQLDHVHEHWFQSARRPMLIGMAHGLAGSAALLLMVLSTSTAFMEGLGFILIFGASSILGMIGVGAAISLPIIFSFSVGRRAYLTVQGLASASSIVLGVLIMWKISLGEAAF